MGLINSSLQAVGLFLVTNIDDKPINALTAAAVTFANGGDNIGVYVPVFLAVGTSTLVAYSVVFVALVAVLVLAA